MGDRLYVKQYSDSKYETVLYALRVYGSGFRRQNGRQVFEKADRAMELNFCTSEESVK